MRVPGSVVRKSSKDFLLDRYIAKGFFGFLIFMTVYNLFFSDLNIMKTLELKRSLIDIEAKKAAVEKENKRLERLLQSIKRNPEYYRERFIREYMQLHKEGDEVILFSD